MAPSRWVRQGLGDEPRDVDTENVGYDIESGVPGTGRLRLIEVKGRATGAGMVTVTKNDAVTSLNKPEDYVLALVEFLEDGAHQVYCLRTPFRREPDFSVTSVNYDYAGLLARAGEPE